jgi:NADPH:quinone reductase-like Zn-dependent oxidoreductase
MDPEPGSHQVMIRVRATSLNYRDQAIVTGKYLMPVSRDIIPLSDGAGEVVAVGAGVTRFKPGDRVMGLFFQGWIAGPHPGWHLALGNPFDGMLAEHVLLDEQSVVAMPANLSFEEAATLPCAPLTAWHGLYHAGKSLRAGDTVLLLGTGGVSIAALQFAKLAGARVIITSSNDEKLARAKALGADEVINYKSTPEWEKEVHRLTHGRGVDTVVEVGGPGTLNRSFTSVCVGGKVLLIGVLGGRAGESNPMMVMVKNANMHGVIVGSRLMFEEMNRAIEINNLKPVVDRVFPFEQAKEAYHLAASGEFFGKIVITV